MQCRHNVMAPLKKPFYAIVTSSTWHNHLQPQVYDYKELQPSNKRENVDKFRRRHGSGGSVSSNCLLLGSLAY